MLNEDEWQAIVSRMVRLTQATVLKWDPLDANSEDDAVFVAEVSDITQYRIWAKDGDGRLPFRLSIYRSVEGRPHQPVETFTTDQFEPGDASISDWIFDLYPLAVRSASGSPELAASLLDELDGLNRNSGVRF